MGAPADRELGIRWSRLDELGEPERERARERLTRLAERHPELHEVHVHGRSSSHHRHGDREVHVVGHVRGGEIVATHTDADVDLALHGALASFERNVRRHREKRRARRREGSD